jgi:hypothetical protein
MVQLIEVNCLVDDRCKGLFKLADLGEHVSESHLRCQEGCQAGLMSVDELKQHLDGQCGA